jgi:glycogen phosphorylase
VLHPVPEGRAGLDAAVDRLADRLPEPLRPLAEIAYNLRWSWLAGGPEVFADLDADRWERNDNDPVRTLIEVPRAVLEAAAADADYLDRVHDVHALVAADLRRPARDLGAPVAPIAFLCAEYGLHRSVRVYSGGLGVLAGDILKEASDLALPTVAVGLFYRNGYFRQRLDRSGWQHEYWTAADPDLLPLALVTDDAGEVLTVEVPVFDRTVVVQVWRLDVGRVPLFLLDADRPENSPVDRFITDRLYDGDGDTRLAQYAVLGIGGLRALRAIGIEPATLHMNEGHAALATLEHAAQAVAAGTDLDDALAEVAARGVFTTHTPVAAGNETYPGDQVHHVLHQLADRLGVDRDRFLGMGRVHPGDTHADAGMTPIALRLSRSVNGVSERHGEVARGMWSELFGRPPADVPITHVTNGVHVPTWLGRPMRDLLDRYLGHGWLERGGDPRTWEAVASIPDELVWTARCESRALLIGAVRERIATDRLRRGEPRSFAERSLAALDPERLTLGFARRAAAYKRLYLLRHDVQRVERLLAGDDAVQLLFAGKAHPADDGAKGILQSMFDLKEAPNVAERVSFLEDYDMVTGALLTTGCDVWINVPRPPLEASGTSGMKSVLNGGLNLSVLDGWWAEGYDGHNGWAIDGAVDDDHHAQDARHADQLYTLLEQQVVPLFHDRGADGVPHGWVAMVKHSLATLAWRFSATRMMEDYARDVYARDVYAKV